MVRKLRVSSGVQGLTGFMRDIFLAMPLVVEIRTATFIFGRMANGECPQCLTFETLQIHKPTGILVVPIVATTLSIRIHTDGRVHIAKFDW